MHYQHSSDVHIQYPPEHIDTLKQLACSDYNHVIRWEAAQSVYKLNENQGIELLQQRLIQDPKASIAKAARMTLDTLDFPVGQETRR